MMHNHPHPGIILRTDVIEPLGLEVKEVARRLAVSRTAMSRVHNGRAGIRTDVAIRLERAGVSTARFWTILQANYELSLALGRRQPPVTPLAKPFA